MELQHQDLSRKLAAREDRFSQLLAQLLQDEHHGQYLITRSGLSAEDHAELRSLADTAHKKFRDELNHATAALRALLALGDPLYITAWVQLSNLLAGWGTYYEPTQPGGEHKVELVAGLLASQPVADDLDGPSDAQMQEIHDEIDHVLEVLFLFNLSMPRGEDHQAEMLRFSGAMQWMVLRGTSYGQHGQDLARALYSPHDDWMLSTYGFTADDVLALGETVASHTEARVNALMQQAGEFADGVMEHLDSEPGKERLSKAVTTQLSSQEGRLEVWGAACMHAFQAGVRQAATFSIEEICAANLDLRPERVEAVLNELSIPVGSLDPAAYTGLFDKSPLIEKPVLEFNGRHLLVVPGMVLRDPVALLEDRFMTRRSAFPVARAKTLDALAVDYLGSMLPGAKTYTHLFYDDAELDGLVLFEDIAFVAEGKGTALSVQSHRGDIKRLERDIRRAVEEAWDQGARARAFLLREGDAAFLDERGTEVVRIPSGTVREVIIVNPTLHELGGHAPQLARLRALGLFPENELPWSVYINDLRVISETCENAAVFLHYLVWRSRLPLGERVTVLDELDLWGCYLMCERFGMLADDGQVTVGNSTTDFDAYYDGLIGHGPKRHRPRKLLEEPVKAFVEWMASERPPGWREAAGACLDLSIPELAFVCVKAKEASRQATREGTPVWIDCGRVVLVGIPKNAEVRTVVEQFEPDDADPTLMIYSRQATPSGVEIVWAKYEKPVTFELSDFERAAFNRPETSPFGFEPKA